jgi:hypothetical protein
MDTRRHCAWIVLAMLLALVMAGCTSTIRLTEIEIDAGRDMDLDASGAQNTTEAHQNAQGDMSGLMDVAQDLMGKNISSVADRLKDAAAGILGGADDAPEDEAASGDQGRVEEVQ